MKKLLVFCFPLLFGVSCATAMGENDLSNFWLFHVTNSFPQNGQITAAERKKVEEPSNEAPNFHYFNEQEVMPGNTTCHFTLNHIVNSHESGNWDDCPYVISVPLSDLADQIWGGYAEDLFIISPFIFTQNTIVFVPEGDSHIENYAHEKPYEVKTYMPGCRDEIVATFVEESFLITSNIAGKEGDVLLGGKPFNQKTFFKKLRSGSGIVELGLHAQTNIGALRFIIEELSYYCEELKEGKTPRGFYKNTVIKCFINFLTFMTAKLKSKMNQKELEKFRVFEDQWGKWSKILTFESEIQKYQKSVFSHRENFEKVIINALDDARIPSHNELISFSRDDYSEIVLGIFSGVAEVVGRMQDDGVSEQVVEIFYPDKPIAVQLLKHLRMIKQLLIFDCIISEAVSSKSKSDLLNQFAFHFKDFKELPNWPLVKEFLKREILDFFEEDELSQSRVSSEFFDLLREIFDVNVSLVSESKESFFKMIKAQVLSAEDLYKLYWEKES